jgi:hypothetical protein
VSTPRPDDVAMPSRWQIDVLVYEERNLYPVLLLQAGRHDDHRRLVGLLARAGLAAPAAWEWERGLWPLTAGCTVELSAGPAAVTVHARGHSLTVGFRAAQPPPVWVRAARRQQQVLFVLLPPRNTRHDEGLILDDVGELGLPDRRHGCLAGSIPLLAPDHRVRGSDAPR